MNKHFHSFKQLHLQDKPLLLGNAWNAQSAKVFEKLGFKAIGTSSAAVAESLGYKDGQIMPFEVYLLIIKRIINSVSIPVSVDLEAGYGQTADDIAENIKTLHQLGVAGINIEDSVVLDGKRSITDSTAFAAKITSITKSLSAFQTEIFINLRSDVFLLGLKQPLAEAKKRIREYGYTGVHGLFFPCVTDIGDIKELAASTGLPVNVMCMPDLPAFDLLQNAGVKRISMGNFINKKLYSVLETELSRILQNGNFENLFGE